MRVKFFSSTYRVSLWSGTATDPVAALEDAVNAWLAANPGVRVVSVHQSVGGGHSPTICMASVWYELDAEPGAASRPAGAPFR